MKAFFKVIAEFFQNMDGSGSSRRLVGIGLTVCGIVGIFLGKDSNACLILVGLGTSLIGVTTFDDHTVKIGSVITQGFMQAPDVKWSDMKITAASTPKSDLGIPDNAG